LHSTDANYRLICNDVAEHLSKNFRFKLQVVFIVLLGLLGLTASVGGIVGYSIAAAVSKERQHFEDEVRRNIATTKQSMKEQITSEFNKDNVKTTLQSVASSEASQLVNRSIAPAIADFEKRIQENKTALDKQLADFKSTIELSGKNVSTDVDSLRAELLRLRTRNDITALADKAIANFDVASYRLLDAIAEKNPESDERVAAVSELYRVYAAYIFEQSSRAGTLHLNAAAINPNKKDEQDLDLDELLPLISTTNNQIERIRIAELIETKAKPGSYHTAKAIADILKHETNLGVFKVLGATLATIVNHRDADGKLDCRALLKWWDANEDMIKREDHTPLSTSPPQQP